MQRSFALLGHPLGHSLSPLLHRLLFGLAGRQGSYTLWDLDPGQLERPDIRKKLESLTGFNITIPYKTRIIPLLDGLDQSAAFYGAVNTVSSRGGRLIGHNTDVDGFVSALEQGGAARALSGKVCVVGVGGAGRTFALEAARRGGQVTLAVRPSSLERAGELLAEMEHLRLAPGRICPLEELSGGWDLLVNATPVGMFPRVDAMPVSPAAFENTGAVFDAVYNPADTLLLRTARDAGCRCVGGMAMLAWQAAVAHRLWDGDEYTPQAMEEVILQLHRALKPSDQEIVRPLQQLPKEEPLL